MINTNYPLQAISYSKKIAKDFSWAKNVIDWYIENTKFDNDKYNKLARTRDNEIIEDDYKYVLNPLNTGNEQYKKFPAKIRNYPLVAPICDLLLGELNNRPKIEQVVAINSDVKNKIKEELNIQIEIAVQQMFINEINNQGINTGTESKEINLEEIIKNINENFDDKLSIQGQEALDFMYYDLNLEDKYTEAFNNMLTFGCSMSYKYIQDNNVLFEVIDPRDIEYHGGDNIKFLEDSDCVVRKLRLTKNQIVERFYNELNDNDIKELENEINEDRFMNYKFSLNGEFHNNTEENFKIDTEYINGFHVAWKSLSKEGELNYIDLKTGQPTTTTVNENYKLNTENGDLSIKWYWVTEFWEGYRFDYYNDGENKSSKYFQIRAVPYQRGEINNKAISKNPYNGILNKSLTGKIQSICQIGYPYQVLYNIYHFQHEKIMNKNKDKIVLFPLSLIPNKAGWDEDKFMYVATNLSFAFYDDLKPGSAAQLQGIKVLDLGLSDYVAKMYEVIQNIKNEFWDAVGMNRQRYGDVQTSAGKGVTEQAILRSAIINQELFRNFDKYKETEAEGLIDLSRIAWLNGKRATFIASDNMIKTIEILNNDYSITEYGVFAKNSFKENQKLSDYKQLGISYLQNNGSMDIIAEILDNDNFSKLKSIVTKAEKAKREYEQYIKEQELKIEEEKTNRLLEIEKLKNDTEKYKADKSYEAIINSTLIKNNESISERKLNLDEKRVENEIILKREKLEIDKNKANKN